MITRATAIRSRLAKKKQGFTLTEIAIVLGVIGLILGAIWTAAASVYANQRTAHANTAVLQIAQGVRTLYSTSTDTGTASADMTTNLINAGAVPSDLINAARNGLVGPFPNGQTMVISTSDSQGFVIDMSGVPQSSCINLLTQIGGASRDAGLFNATATTDAAPATTDTMASAPPLDVAITPTIASATAANSEGGCVTQAANKVLFGFTLK